MDSNQPINQEIPIFNEESIQFSLQAVAPEPSSDQNLNDGSRGTIICLITFVPPISGMSTAPSPPSSPTSSMSKTFQPLPSPPVKSPVPLTPPLTPLSQVESPFPTIKLKRKGSNEETQALAPSKRVRMYEIDVKSDTFRNAPEEVQKKFRKSKRSKEGRDKVKNRMAQLESDNAMLLQKNADLNLKLKLLEEESSKDKIQLSKLEASNAQLKAQADSIAIGSSDLNKSLDDDCWHSFETLLEPL